MNRFCLSLAAAAFFFAAPASAEKFDTSTLSCEKLNAAYERKTKDDLAFINGILNWMGGYHATEAQGTIVDWKQYSQSFDQTIEYCAGHPKVGVMSASAKFMGEHLEEPGADALDLAIVTCENTLKDDGPVTGNTLMWLAGYHTSTNKESKILDSDKLTTNVTKIAEYCVANPSTGLITVSEKFMAE